MSHFGSTDYYTEVAKGNITGEKLVTIRCSNPEVGSILVDLWHYSSDMVYPVAGETWEILSDDVNDTSAGTGARTVEVPFLDDSYVLQKETLTLNGTTPVLFTSTSAFRPYPGIDSSDTSNGIRVSTVGSGGANAGNITIRNTSGGAVRSYIGSGSILAKQAHYTVEAGKRAYLVYACAPIRKNKDIIITTQFTEADNGIFVDNFPVEIYEQFAQFQPKPLGPLLAKTDVRVKAISENPLTSGFFVFQLLVVDE